MRGFQTAFSILLFLIAAFLTPALAGYTVSTVTGNLLVTPAHGGDGSAWGRADCVNCHPLRIIHKQATQRTRGIVRRKGYDTCTACHGSNGSTAPRRCAVCHNAQNLPLKPIQTGAQKHDFSVKQVLPLSDAQCTVCHIKPDMDGVFELNVDLTPIRDKHGEILPYESQSDFCLRCHNHDHQPAGVHIKSRRRYGINDPLTAIEDDYRYIDKHGLANGMQGPYSGLRDPGYRYSDVVECTDCHVMHGTRNRKLILDDSRKGVFRLSPELREHPYSAIVRLGNYAQMCVLCHAMEHPEVDQGRLDTGNGLSGVHDATSDCRQCHTHGAPVEGGL